MKKSLIALAVAGAFAAPAAFAATANVDISGKVAFGVTKVGGVANDTIRMEDMNSRITLAGSEDLGGGLKAGFSLTYGFATDATATADSTGGIASGGRFSGQNQILTLSGAFGTVVLGTHDNLVKSIRDNLDLFGDQTGDARSVLNVGLADARANNVVAYVSPNFNGFSLAVGRAMDESNGNTDASDIDMATATYKNGPIYAAAGYHTAQRRAANANIEGMRLGFGYTMGALKLVALYQDIENAGGANDDRKTWGLGAAYAMGPMTFKGQYYSVDDKQANQDAKLMAVGMDYALSKRTTVQAAYSKFKNDSGAEYGNTSGFGGSEAIGVVAGQDPSRISVGIRHTF